MMTICIKHYISERVKGISNPGGKFLEALKKLITDVNKFIEKQIHQFIRENFK